MTKIKILGDHIIFDGHADTQRECKTVTLMCDNLAKSIDFKTIKYEKGYAEFEKIGNVKDTKDLMFPPAPSENITIIFDSHITKVVCESIDSPYGTPYGGGEWTASGQSVNGIYDQNLTYTVTLESGYVIDTVTSSEGTNLTIGADGLTFSGQVTSGSDATVTITSKQGGATKQTIDVSTLSGWESLASGDHSIAVKTKASGYLDSASSNAVTVSKAAPLNRPTIEWLSTAYIRINNPSSNGNNVTAFKIYNGNDLLGTIDASKTVFNPKEYLTNSGSYNIGVKTSGTNFSDSALSNTITVYKSYPPTISLNDYTLTITKDEQNPTNMEYVLYSNNEQVTNIYSLTLNLTTESKFVIGQTYNLTVKANKVYQKWYPSDNSNVVTYTCETVKISATLTNITAASDNATTISVGETKTLTYTAADGYELPDNVTVTGATGVWNKANGTLTLSNPTAKVTFTIAGVEAASGYSVTITSTGYGVSIYDGTSSSGTLLGTIGDNTPKTVTCKSGNLYLESGDGNYTGANTVVSGGVSIVSEGSYPYDGTFSVIGDGTITVDPTCLIEGTQITLADGSTKAIEDITYDDELLVWNFYDGKFDRAKPTWIKVEEVVPRYNLVKFSNGAEVGFVGAGGEKGYHRIFNKEAGAFTYTGNFKETPNGTTTFAEDCTYPTVISQEIIEKEVKFYNVITDKHYNLFANGILTSCKLSNKYRIEDMKYVGDKLISDKEEVAYFKAKDKLRK